MSPQQSLLKVFHSSNNNNPNLDETESINSNKQKQQDSSRKVIKATITIPLPKADLTGVITKSTRSRKNNHATGTLINH